MGLAIIVGLNAIVALRLLGFVPEIKPQTLRKLFPWMYVGFTINAFSGLSLLAANLDNDAHNFMFLTKLTFIALAMINMELERNRVFEDPAFMAGGAIPMSARKFALLSLFLWTMAIICGRLSEYPYLIEAYLGIGRLGG
jgi:hypothetical protein